MVLNQFDKNSQLAMFHLIAFHINHGKMLNINVKSEEPLKILRTSGGSSPGVDMSIHVTKLP